MPVTKTAKRALRASHKKALANAKALNELSKIIGAAKKSKNVEKIRAAMSLTDRAAKKRIIHKNKAARIKSALSKLLPAKKVAQKTRKVSLKKKSK